MKERDNSGSDTCCEGSNTGLDGDRGHRPGWDYFRLEIWESVSEEAPKETARDLMAFLGRQKQLYLDKN